MEDKNADQNNVQYRLCKKVAELTQVVHLLFTSNHTKEVELEALADAYQYEISLVVSDSEKRIQSRENTIIDIRKQTVDLAAEIGDIQYRFRTLETEYEEVKEREKRKGTELADVREECQKLRDLLINAHNDVEQLRQGMESKLDKNDRCLAHKNEEIERLSHKIHALERLLFDSQRNADTIAKMAQKRSRTFEQELDKFRMELRSSYKNRDQWQEKCKRLEKELKECQKSASGRVAELLAMCNQAKACGKSDIMNHAKDAELSHLKQELQRYRLELFNRDKNFNQMFAPTPLSPQGDATHRGVPLIVDRRAGLLAKHQHLTPALETIDNSSVDRVSSVSKIPSLITGGRSASIADIEKPNTVSLRKVSSACGGVSYVSASDSKMRIGRLTKPRPPILRGK